MNRTTNIVLAVALLTGAAGALAQSPIVHANRGQSDKKMASDEANCHAYSSKKTGFDPVVLAENSTPLQPGKGLTSVPSDGSSMMGGSAAGATSSGGGTTAMASPETGTASSTGQGAMGASSGGMTGSGAGTGQMGASSGGMTGSGAESGQMGASSGGTTGSGGGGQMGASSGGMASSGGGSQMGASSAGATGSSASQAQLAQQDSADLYNRTFARCMTSRGYMVESVNRGGTP
jgi:hypothetical protein